ncbi:helix-turn-helix transcriptional regulator [Magnetospirillum sulfuroxidans]|uniref:LuxR family transcriptional regulator n=1 Tax=Magnetospirillum sulfuroxidans TaxID=611300 RepID=A0ABS5I7G6_9PROT|nr:LuxR family transcriptional regulator [Magnetospirillum sulfuroxidans]MBR9970371.1 LuxR family transcriptional regulator [Magnetospirillum sulfuroxidans]
MAELKTALVHWGFPHMACGAFGDPDRPLDDDTVPAVVVDYPQEWQKHYFEKNYVTIDPVVTRAFQAHIPYRWDQLRDLTTLQNRMFNEAHEIGLLHGITVPIHGPTGGVFVASIASPHDDIDHLRSLSVANILVTQAYSVLVGLKHPGAPGAPVALTGRERECLIWSARGKSSWDIGVILNISDNTVNFHLKNAMSKLKTSTRVLAIVKAIRMGLIVP